MQIRRDDRGVTAVEYALFIGLVGLVIMFGVSALSVAFQAVAVTVVSDPIVVGGAVAEAATVEDDTEGTTPGGSPCASHQVWRHPTGPCTPLLAPTETSGTMGEGDDESFDVLDDYVYAESPYGAAMTITGCVDDWQGNAGMCSINGDEIEYDAPNNKEGTVTVTYTLTVSYPYSGQTYTATLPGVVFSVAVRD